MRAVVVGSPGGPEVLGLRRVPIPAPGPGQIRVRVLAFGLNRADLLQRRGLYPAPPDAPADIPGLEYAGEVDVVGPGAGRWAPGARVMGIVGGGAYAEYVVVDEREAIEVPASLSIEEAAAVPEAFLTAHDALFTQLGLRSGERLLIHAVGSGVGTAALQLARAEGATVIGTSRSGWKLERAAELGLEHAVDTSAEYFAEAVERLTGGGEANRWSSREPENGERPASSAGARTRAAAAGVDAILDLVGGPRLNDNLRCLVPRGRMVVVGLVAGARAEIDLGLLLRHRLTLRGTVLRSRSLEEKIAVTDAFRTHALPLLADGRIRPVLERVYPVTEIQDAHRFMEENRNFGKIVIRWEE